LGVSVSANGRLSTCALRLAGNQPRYCPGTNANGGYLCETGHCCGETGCCTYYYELWWFWLLWTALIMFSCCCAYRHRRAKVQAQQQQRRQREISLLAYRGTSFATRVPQKEEMHLRFLASLKLPSYEEVAAQPSTPPPPYNSVFTAGCTAPSALAPPSTSFLLDAPLPTRPAQAPPKQTLFSPCVDVFPAEPEEEANEDDVDADESQYRHRRLTGDSGIEVCRCRVQGQEAQEEDAEPESGSEGKNSDLHDSVDCPSKCAATPCHPREEAGDVVIVVETA
uniref:Si:ch73-290k24.6 n=1 Tax=Hippocampus comes TaxID=109280 RepID=A0A3Q2YCC6_HIPCM